MFDFNPLSPEFQANPYAYYHGMRSAMPVLFWEPWQMWFLTRYADCVMVLKDSRFGREAQNVYTPEQLAMAPKPPENQIPLIEMESRWMLLRDAPTHTRLRTLVHKAFTPRTIEKMRQHIEEITQSLLDDVQHKGKMDVIADLAFPLPVTVI